MYDTLSYKQIKQRIKKLEEKDLECKETLDWLKLFSHAFESSNHGLIIANTDHTILYTNNKFQEIFGYSRDELKDKAITFLHPEDQIPLVNEALKKTMEGSWEGELIAKKKDGTQFPLLVSSSRVLDDRGNIIAHMASLEDITLRKQTLKKLEESEQRYRHLFESSRDAISISKQDGSYVDANQAFLDLFGYTQEEVEKSNSNDRYVHKKDRERYTKELEKYGTTKSHELALRKKNGEAMVCQISSSVMRASDGSIIGYQNIIRDITQQKQIERALRESEEKWRSVFKESKDPISITNRDGLFVDCNQAFLDLFGYTKEEMKSSNAIDLYAKPEDRKKFIKEIEKKGSVQDYEILLRKKNGEEMITLFTSSVMRAPDGSIIGYQNIVRNITERERLLKELRQSEAQKKAILDASVDRIRLSDTNMKIIWANDTHRKELGTDPNDLVGKYCYKVFVDRDSPCPECPSEKAIASGKIENAFLTRPSMKNKGQMVYLDAFAVPLKDESGNVVTCIQITRNVTEKIQVAQELKKSEEKYRTILENIAEGYYEFDLEGNFLFFNDAVPKILGYTRDELLGENIRRFLSQKSANNVSRDFKRVIRKGRPIRLVDQEMVRKSGTRKSVESSLGPIRDSQDTIVGFRGVIRDVTDYKKAERSIRKREKELAKANKRLIETNAALSVLAKNLDVTRKESEKQIIQKIRYLVLPVLEKLRQDKNIERYQIDFELLLRSLRDLSSDMADDMKIALALTSTELRIASLIRNGMSNEEISKHLYISAATVKTHRKNIRKKLDLNNSGINLATYMKKELFKD